MPKRSNIFQQVIAHIYAQMAPEGATVTESGVLKEQKTGQEREVDILIEHKVAGIGFCIGVEVRDRADTDDIEWIDCMIGKYIDLPVDKKVAVSHSGFSKGARAKAEAHNIYTKTLEEAITTDWPAEFTTLGFAYVERKDRIVEIVWDLDPPMGREPIPTDEFTDETGARKGKLAELVNGFLKTKFQSDLSAHLRERFHELFRYLADLNNILLVETSVSPDGLYILGDSGNRHTIRKATVRVACCFTYNKADMQHRRFEDALVSEGKLIDKNEQIVGKMATVQFPDAKKGWIFIEPASGRRTSRKNPTKTKK
jgi:hypothetical protein